MFHFNIFLLLCECFNFMQMSLKECTQNIQIVPINLAIYHFLSSPLSFPPSFCFLCFSFFFKFRISHADNFHFYLYVWHISWFTKFKIENKNVFPYSQVHWSLTPYDVASILFSLPFLMLFRFFLYQMFEGV